MPAIGASTTGTSSSSGPMFNTGAAGALERTAGVLSVDESRSVTRQFSQIRKCCDDVGLHTHRKCRLDHRGEERRVVGGTTLRARISPTEQPVGVRHAERIRDAAEV